jgi:hypothetical protein
LRAFRNVFVPTTAPQAGERAVLARAVELAAFAEARSQSHHLAQPVHDRGLALLIASHDHVKAVRAQVDSCHDLGRLGAETRLRIGHHDGPGR